MLKFYNFITKYGTSVRRLSSSHQRSTKWTCSKYQKSTNPFCRCISENSRNRSAYTNSVFDSQVSRTRAMAEKLGIDHDALLNCVADCPSLLNVKSMQWEECFRELINNGFTGEQSLHMITKYPPLLHVKSQDLKQGFQVWRNADLKENHVLSLLKTCPHFLLLSEREVACRLPYLKALGSTKGVVLLLKGAPNLMFENWNNVVEKISFLRDEMGIESKHILKCFALNRSVLFLKTRFVFLVRCSKFVKPKVDADTNIPNKNPPLSKIIETNDEDFATNIAGVTLEEYEVFEELFAVELEDSDFLASDSE